MTNRFPPPRRRPPRFDRWRLWQPDTLEGIDPGPLSYVVVDEIVEPTCVLAVSGWPRIDGKGRLRFRLDERPHLVRVSRGDLARYLRRHRTSTRHRRREVRIGDVYAAVARTERLPEPESGREARELTGETPLDWLEPPVYDVTADARDAAKVALYGAVAPVLGKKQA